MMNVKRYISMVAGLLLLAVPVMVPALDWAVTADVNKTEQEALQKVKQNIYERNWEAAVEALGRFMAGAKDRNLLAESSYWLAYSLNKNAEDQDEEETEIELKRRAFDALTELEKSYPDSRWLKDGRILKVEIADDLVDLGLSGYKKYIASASREDQDVELKLMAVQSLMNMDSDKAFPILERIVRTNPDSRMRDKALFVVSQCAHPGRVALLVEAAKSDSNPDIREKAVFWLGQSDSREALKALKALYTADASVRLREKIVFSISQLDGPEAATTLMEIYRGEQALEIKKKIIFWLGQMDDEEARKFLESLLQ